MGKIAAMGGGEIGMPMEGCGNYPIETLEIDAEIVRMSGKANPGLPFMS